MFCSVIFIFASVAKGNDETVIAEGSPFNLFTLVLVAFSIYIGIWFLKSRRSDLPIRGYLDPAITPVMAILLCGAMFLLGGLGAMLGSKLAVQDSIPNMAWMFSFAMIAQIPVVFAYALLRKRCGSRHVGTVAITAFVVFVPMALATAGVLHGILTLAGLESPTVLGHETLTDLAIGPWTASKWVIVVCATIGAGVFEEVLYRGLILPTFVTLIGGKTAWYAIFVTSIFFAVMHAGAAPISAMVGLFVLSIGLCWARVKSGGVIAPILIHVVFNTMNIAFVYSTTL